MLDFKKLWRDYAVYTAALQLYYILFVRFDGRYHLCRPASCPRISTSSARQRGCSS